MRAWIWLVSALINTCMAGLEWHLVLRALTFRAQLEAEYGADIVALANITSWPRVSWTPAVMTSIVAGVAWVMAIRRAEG